MTKFLNITSNLLVYWKQSSFFSENLQETIDFLDNECTGIELVGLSEIFDEITEKIQNWAFIDALQRTAERFHEESAKYHVKKRIEFAEEYLSDEVYQQRYPDGK